jgi:hypothetical protein
MITVHALWMHHIEPRLLTWCLLSLRRTLTLRGMERPGEHPQPLVGSPHHAQPGGNALPGQSLPHTIDTGAMEIHSHWRILLAFILTF